MNFGGRNTYTHIIDSLHRHMKYRPPCFMKSVVLVKKEIEIYYAVSFSLFNRYLCLIHRKGRRDLVIYLYFFFHKGHFLNTASAVYTSQVYGLLHVCMYVSCMLLLKRFSFGEIEGSGVAGQREGEAAMYGSRLHSSPC